jgi:hypothetical protein
MQRDWCMGEMKVSIADEIGLIGFWLSIRIVERPRKWKEKMNVRG